VAGTFLSRQPVPERGKTGTSTVTLCLGVERNFGKMGGMAARAPTSFAREPEPARLSQD
jgi:hypothetical protein